MFDQSTMSERQDARGEVEVVGGPDRTGKALTISTGAAGGEDSQAAQYLGSLKQYGELRKIGTPASVLELVPIPTLDRLSLEMDAGDAPMDEEETANALEILYSAYPNGTRAFPDQAKAQQYDYVMSRVVRDYPRAIIKEAIERTVRTCRMLPSCGSFAGHADAVLRERRDLRRLIDLQRRDHHDREQARQEVRRQEAERQEWRSMTPEQRRIQQREMDQMILRMRAGEFERTPTSRK